MPNEFLNDRLRNSRVFQKRNSSMYQTVKTEFAIGTPRIPADTAALMRELLPQAGLKEKIGKPVGNRHCSTLFSYRFECSGMQRCCGFVGTGEAKNVML